MTTNTEPTTRELVYLAGLLHDDTLRKKTSLADQFNSIQLQLAEGSTNWLNPLLKLSTQYAVGSATERTDSPAEQRLQSVFQQLSQAGKAARPCYFSVGSFQLDKAFFPKEQSAQVVEQEGDALWKALASELSQQAGQPINSLADNLLFLLEKYALTLPIPAPHLPDVSLYDHLKSTAALGLCLYDYLTEQNKLTPPAIQSEEAPLLLIGGDLSGIQAFIYDIIGRSAAKNLKGRSFYLQLIVDSIVQRLLDGLHLRQANIIYSSGGGFYLLAPNTAFTRNTLLTLQNEITAKLRDEQGVKLFLAIDCIAVTQQHIFGVDKTIAEVWGGLTEKLSAQKKRRFSPTLATTDYDYFFTPSEVGGESRGNRDAITGEEFHLDPASGKREDTFPIGPANNPEEENQRVRKSTFDQIRLGRTLRETIRYVVKAHTPIAGWNDDELFGEKTARYFNPLGLNQYYYFIGDDQLDKFKDWSKKGVNNVQIQRVNNADTTDFQLPGINQTYGFILYGGNTIPRDSKGEPKYFDELTGHDGLNFRRLGVLRMDVDNLGFLFKNGFAGGTRTFSRYSTLSRSLDYFFKGYLNHIRGSDPDFREFTFILYAGGDDLFIVGKWDVALRFAERIQTEFAAWTCHSSALGISGGVAVVPPKFPIAKAADQSADEEKRAKNHTYPGGEKNSLSLFGTPLAWGEEWRIVSELKTDLKRYIGGEKSIPKALIGKIGTLYAMQQEQIKNKQNPSWRWLSAYDLGRARERAKSKDAKAFFDQLKTDLFTNSTYKGEKLTNTKTYYDFLTLLNVAARWAELEMRSEDTQTKYTREDGTIHE